MTAIVMVSRCRSATATRDYILTAGPPNPDSVLLIENPHSFEEAVASGCAEKVALIATFGYGLSRSGEAFGNS